MTADKIPTQARPAGSGRRATSSRFPVLAPAALILTLLLVGAAILHYNTAHASSAAGPWADATQANPVSGQQPASVSAQTEMDEVWSATMTVGLASDETNTYTGYVPGVSQGTEGSLDETGFTVDGAEYVVLEVYQQDFNSFVQQLVFHTDVPLPDDLVLRVDGADFPVSDATSAGVGGNILIWRLSEELGWQEGENVSLALLEPATSPEPGPFCS